MLAKLKVYVENNFNGTLAVAFLLGLVVPGLDRLPSSLTLAMLAGIIFLSCFRVQYNGIVDTRLWPFVKFYFLRFFLFPIGLWLISQKLWPSYALPIYLLALLPPATSLPALVGIFGGNLSLSFVISILGNMLAPIAFPLLLRLSASGNTPLDFTGILLTLGVSVVIPIVIHIPLRGHRPSRRWIDEQGSFYSMLLLAGTMMLALAKRRALIFHSPGLVAVSLVVASLEFGVFYFLGWYCLPRARKRDRLTFALGSGLNNIVLGISLALLYFPPVVAVFMVAAEIPWVLTLIPFQSWLKKQPLID